MQARAHPVLGVTTLQIDGLPLIITLSLREQGYHFVFPAGGAAAGAKVGAECWGPAFVICSGRIAIGGACGRRRAIVVDFLLLVGGGWLRRRVRTSSGLDAGDCAGFRRWERWEAL